MRKLSAKWVRKCLNADEKRQRCQSSEQILELFRLCAIKMISCHDWWPWTRPGYITLTRRQSNNPWRGGIEAHPAPSLPAAPQKIPSAKIRWKSSRLPRFYGIKKASSSLIIFERDKLSMRSFTQLCWCNWRTFWRKNANAEGWSPRQCPGSLENWNLQETGLPGLPFSWSPSLFSGYGPIGLPPFPWTKKKQLKFRHFRSDVEVIAAAEIVLDRKHSEFFLVSFKS